MRRQVCFDRAPRRQAHRPATGGSLIAATLPPHGGRPAQQGLEGLPRRSEGGRCDRPLDRRRLVRGARRAVGLRQEHDASHDRRPRGDLLRHDRDRRPRGERGRGPRPRHRDGLPELRALSAPLGATEPRVPAAAPATPREPAAEPRLAFLREGTPRGDRRDGRAGRVRGEDARDRKPSCPQAQGTLRRAAPARRAWSGARARSGGLSPRRAALEPRRAAAARDACGTAHAASPHRRHDGARDARSGGGDDPRGPARRHEGRRDPAGRLADRDLRSARRRLRRGLHRDAGDEPARWRGAIRWFRGDLRRGRRCREHAVFTRLLDRASATTCRDRPPRGEGRELACGHARRAARCGAARA